MTLRALRAVNALAAVGTVVLGALSVGAVGCAHQVAFHSEPPGAEVYIEDELACTTPCVWEERSTHADEVRVEVRGEEEAVRFDLLRDGFMFQPVILGVVAGGLALVGAGAASVTALGAYSVTTFILVGGAGLFPGTPIPLLLLGASALVAAFAYALAVSLASVAPRIPLMVAGEGSRIADNEVYVDFENDEVYGDAGDDIRRLVGVRPGKREMPLPRDDEDELELPMEPELVE